MWKKSLALFLIVMIFATVMPFQAFAVLPDWKLVVRVKGTVESQRQNFEQWDKIWRSRMLHDGDKARTLSDSAAQIRLADQSTINVGSDTVVEISKFVFTPEKRTSKIKLIMGKIRVGVEKFLGKESNFEITTPNAVLAARGTDFFVMYELGAQGGAGLTNLAVFEGNVAVTSAAQTTIIAAGNTAAITAQGAIILNPAGFVYPGAAGAPASMGADASLMQPGPSAAPASSAATSAATGATTTTAGAATSVTAAGATGFAATTAAVVATAAGVIASGLSQSNNSSTHSPSH